MSDSVLLSQAAGERCAWPLSATAQGTSLPASVLVSASASGVFAAARPKLHDRAQVAVQQLTDMTYQEMTRIAANGGGQSGSHPAWDPV